MSMSDKAYLAIMLVFALGATWAFGILVTAAALLLGFWALASLKLFEAHREQFFKYRAK